LRFADTHCHLDFPEFDRVRGQVLSACETASVELIVVPSVERRTWKRVCALANLHAVVYAAIGMHPLFIANHQESDLAQLESMLVENKRTRGSIVAVGEVGLDATVGDLVLQEYFFRSQVELAVKYDLPVILHSRKTHSKVLEVVKSSSLVGGVLHAFSGSYEQLSSFVAAGIKIGVGGVITWPKSMKTRKAIAKAPLDSLLLETDAPDMAVSVDGVRVKSMPVHVIKVFDVLCEIREESPELIADTLWFNSQALFLKSRV